jgi:bacterioferritin-associated ferredoxin
VRFGSIALCGSCVEALRKLLRASETAVVEADA